MDPVRMHVSALVREHGEKVEKGHQEYEDDCDTFVLKVMVETVRTEVMENSVLEVRHGTLNSPYVYIVKRPKEPMPDA